MNEYEVLISLAIYKTWPSSVLPMKMPALAAIFRQQS
jgi:hypothetical protein